eukprot:5291061-Amphidinium_carterae.1
MPCVRSLQFFREICIDEVEVAKHGDDGLSSTSGLIARVGAAAAGTETASEESAAPSSPNAVDLHLDSGMMGEQSEDTSDDSSAASATTDDPVTDAPVRHEEVVETPTTSAAAMKVGTT